MAVDNAQVVPIQEVAGAFQVIRFPSVDARGWFRDSVRLVELPEHIRDQYRPQQVSVSCSLRNVARGMHFSVTDPDAAYFQTVTCVEGHITDILVDLRLGSPTFRGEFITELAPELGVSLLMPPGVGHGFKVVADSATVVYTMSLNFPLARTGTVRLEGASNRFSLSEHPVVSDRDRDSPSIDEAMKSGLLPRWRDANP